MEDIHQDIHQPILGLNNNVGDHLEIFLTLFVVEKRQMPLLSTQSQEWNLFFFSFLSEINLWIFNRIKAYSVIQ